MHGKEFRLDWHIKIALIKCSVFCALLFTSISQAHYQEKIVESAFKAARFEVKNTDPSDNLILAKKSSNPSKKVHKVPARLKDFILQLESNKSALQGGVIAVLYKGEVIHKSAFGKQKGKFGQITKSTLFPLASVSKAVSATAIALLVDEGKLNLDEKFQLPYLKNPVSLTNILSHTTGYQFSGNIEIEHGLNRKRLLEVLKKQQPHCNPGHCYRYSNATFSLLEEALNRKKFSLQLAMDNMRSLLKTDGVQILPLESYADIAYPHLAKKIRGNIIHRALPFPPYYPKATPASAGVFASIDGLIEVFKLGFGYRPDLISQNVLDRMHTPVSSNRDIFRWSVGWPMKKKGVESYYALGWRVLKAKGHPGKDLVFHSGGIAGISSFMGFIPSEDIGIIIVVNQHSGFPVKTAFNFWAENYG